MNCKCTKNVYCAVLFPEFESLMPVGSPLTHSKGQNRTKHTVQLAHQNFLSNIYDGLENLESTNLKLKPW